MRPIQDIEAAKKYINLMKGNLDKIKNPKVKDFQIDALNAFIVLVNTFEKFLNDNYQLKSIDGLICSRLMDSVFAELKSSEGQLSMIGLKEVVHRVSVDITNSEARKEALVSMLYTEDALMCLRKGNEEFCSREDWLSNVDDLVNQLKTQSEWN
ncbi:hypothetical protein [Tenacibaculum sp. 190524A02b]|uniref:Uncharacterized protein n=1 Tax=Tenacibaculum vairaonense TaxID=3137860 RepID=A0ABP1FEC9_9FLAO